MLGGTTPEESFEQTGISLAADGSQDEKFPNQCHRGDRKERYVGMWLCLLCIQHYPRLCGSYVGAKY